MTTINQARGAEQAEPKVTEPAAQSAAKVAIQKAPATPMERLKADFEKWKPTLKALLPRHINPERVIKIAMNAYLNNPELQKCTTLSMVKATLQAAELGLEPSPLLGEAWFIPYLNNRKVRDGDIFKNVPTLEVQMQPGYLGLIKLAKQTGDISDVYAVIVDECESDPEFFLAKRGTTNEIHHVVRMDAARTGKMHAVYAVVKFKDGTCHFEVLSPHDVEQIRQRSKAKDAGPWVTDYNAMAKKTAIKQALKTVPKSPEKPQLAEALATDTGIETGELYSTDAAATLDAEGIDTTEKPQPASQTRTDVLASKLGVVAHDKDGVVIEMAGAR